TANSGTIAQSGTTITLSGAHFPNDLVRGTITYSGHDDSTALVTGYTNSTVITVDTSKTVNASNTYSIDYNGLVTWGINREVTAAGSGTGNRTVTVTDTAHYLRSGDKVKITGALSAFVNGTHVIEVIDADSYRFTLPHDGVASVTGEIRSRGVASGWLSSANAYTVDSSPKGNNATLAVSAIAIGAIKTVSVYNFGAGYTEPPTLTTTTGNRNAELSATLGAFAEYDGYYVGSTGLISGTPKIQDNFYYQDFSYVLKTDMDITDYRDSVKRLTHPSGMLLFGEVAFRNKVSVEMFDAGERNVNSTDDDVAKTAMGYSPKYRLTVPTINSYANLRHQNTATLSSGGYESYLDPKGGILELHTAKHPWQAMDGKIDIRGDENLLYENFRDVTMQRTSAVGSNAYATITEPLHNLEVGDTVVISGDRGQWASEGDFFNGKYTVYSVPTTNTYTVYMYRGDPGASVSASAYLYVYMEDNSGQILLETGDQVLNEYSDDDVLDYVRVETVAFANTWRANTSNWESPFNTAPIDEIDSGKWLLEHGGSYLYPPIEFPIAESGTVSIDMSFNSDVLLEDYTTGDLGMSDSGYVLTEASGSVGTGPARYISLEEDTEGIEEGHIAQSIPYMETEVITNLLDSMRQGLLTEDGMDDLVLEPFTVDDFDLVMEDGYKLLQDDGRTGYDSASELGYIVVEFGHYRPEERRRFITEHNAIIGGSYFAVIYTDHLSTSILGRMLYEDGDIIFGEDTFGGFLTEITSPPIDKEIEFDLLDSIRGGLQTEDGLDYIVGEDNDSGEGVQASKFISEQPPFERTPVIVHDPLISPSGRLTMEDTEATLLAFEDSEVSIKSYILEEGKFGYVMAMEKFITGEREFNLTAGTGQHIGMEDGYHYLFEDESVPQLEEGWFKYPTGEVEFNLVETFGWHILAEDDYTHLIYEDETRLLIEYGQVQDPVGEIEFNLYDTTGWHFLTEDGYTHLRYEDGTRPVTEESHVKDLTVGIEKTYQVRSGQHTIMEDGYHYLYEDETVPLMEEGWFKYATGEIEYNLVESTGWHILAEDDYTHLIYEDETRLLTEASEIQSTLHIPIVSTDDITKWTLDNYINNSVTTATTQTIGTSFGMQPFRPHYASQWSSLTTGMFVEDKFAMEDETGVILLELFGNRNYLMHEEGGAAGEDIMNPLRGVINSILLEVGSVDFIEYEEATIAGLWFLLEDGTGQVLTETGDQLLNEEPAVAQGLQRALLESSKLTSEGYGTDYDPNQFWTVLPAYQYTKVLERFTGKITFADGGTTGSGSETLFTTELN
ncbi:MAG: hypothetical protein QGH83_00205, partial [Candidatus Pacebacteria bacterium]|nr:hypothetical protein [Candidatus Paceibacterota bacterium]